MAYQNELESWYTGLPSQVQEAFNWAYDPIDSMLKSVAGDPDDLVRAGAVYAGIGPQICTIGTTVQQEAGALAGHWSGDAYNAFVQKIADLHSALPAIVAGILEAR